ncbi:MAG: DNA translocase FtsK 4TM domain-containing protein [Rhodobacteraceae bacterium]|nr:DNA translocase FtsK 4TM domain-containing protein [Paracoccaceae bacterium]
MTYQLQQRDTLLGEYWQQFLINRGKELSGAFLVFAAVLLALALGSYSPDDPGLFTATSAQPENLVGIHGAAVASYLVSTTGFAAWLIVAILLAWGLRLIRHHSPFRILIRFWYMPLAILLASAFLATEPRSDAWQHHFGLGGIIGDTVFSSMVIAYPSAEPAIEQGVRYTGYLFLLPLALMAFGVTFGEIRWAGLLALRAPFILLQKRRRRRRDTRRLSGIPHEEPDYDEDFMDNDLSHMPVEEDIEFQAIAAPDEPRILLTDDPGSEEPAPPSHRKRRPGKRHLGQLVKGIGSLFFSDNEEQLDQLNQRRFATTTISKRTHPHHNPTDEMFADADDPAAGHNPAAETGDEPRIVMTRKRSQRSGRPSRRASQHPLPLDRSDEKYISPSLDLLSTPDHVFTISQSVPSLQENARLLEGVLEDYGVHGEIKTVRPGPVVTLYQLTPAPGLKTSRVMGLADDIARSMSALSARISTVPGESYIGIELPNSTRETVYFKELAARSEFSDSTKRLPIALGKNIGGDPVIVDLASMPHLLIAGTTGSGKSVAINTMILSLLYSLSPEQCRLILVDPKMLELSVYDGIPHLMAPVVTDPKNAVAALKWVVVEMEERYRKMSRLGVRNIDGYNIRMREAAQSGRPITREHQIGFDPETGSPLYETETIETETLPYIVVVVDEMADLMIVAGKEIEACVQRLAQMARASGIHIILATQRPSVDVITGVIKANFPTRISFQVSQKVDSRTILGEQGAEQLLGQGDMLYMSGGGRVERVHGPFVSDHEVEQVVEYLRSLGPPDYHPEILNGPDDGTEDEINQVLGLERSASGDEEYEQAVAIIMRDEKVSVSYVQRKMEIGYNKAARIVERMEEEGIISPANHVGKREILRVS